MNKIHVSEYARWVLCRALLLNNMRRCTAPATILQNQANLLEESLDAGRTYMESLAERVCAIEVETCRQSSPCYFCRHLSHEDLDEDGIPNTTCLLGHPSDSASIDERGQLGCIDHDPEGATMSTSQIAEDIEDAKKKYSAESVQAALATIGEYLYRKYSHNIVGCQKCSTSGKKSAEVYCSDCGRLLHIID